MKTHEQWERLWDEHARDHANRAHENDLENNLHTARKLLLIYIGKVDDSPTWYDQGFNIGTWRLMTGRWNTHHAREILDIFYDNIKPIYSYKNLPGLLDLIQRTFADTPINKNGDLAKIFKVIEEKTGHVITVKYDDYGMNHLGAMAKDVVDSLKPYKYSETHYYLKRDLKQPLTAIDTLTRGVFSIAGAPLVFLRNLSGLIFFSRAHDKDKTWSGWWDDFLDNAKLTVTQPFSYLSDGFFLLLHGLFHMLPTLLVLPQFVKIGYRYFFGDNKEAGTIENRITNSKSIQKLFNALDKIEDTDERNYCKSLLRSEIHRKYLKGTARGEQTTLNIKNELWLFSNAQYSNHQKHAAVTNDANDAIVPEEDAYLRRFRKMNTI